MAKIYKHDSAIFISSDNTVIFYDLKTGSEKLLTVSTPKPSEKPNSVTSLTYSGDLLAVTTEDKHVLIYDKTFHIQKTFTSNRVINKSYLTSSKDLILADKTGDVYLYELNQEDNFEKPKLLLGHQSIILDFTLTPCEKYIITCDRDEKIRVSHFPNSYNIASFCLGHTEFITNISVVKKDVLISASGDGTVRFWDYLKGQQLNVLDTNKYVEENTNKLLEKFMEEVGEEKITVSALPITNMQVFVSNKIYFAVSIYSYDAIQLYSANVDDLQYQYLTKFSISKPVLFLMLDVLYLFSDVLNVFDYKKCEEVKSSKDIVGLQSVLDNYKNVVNIVSHNESLSCLYKRKFDNVQEYLERKKQRLEIK